jgi:hypothetical protein
MGDSTAVRTTNLYKSMPLNILAVPILANYGGNTIGCDGDWKQGAEMIIGSYPVARDDVNYVLAPELDLTGPEYDLYTDEGMYNVWEAVVGLQTPDEKYTIIVGFVRDRVGETGGVLGYTIGLPATIVVESENDMLATIPHEIAHCYKLGDEYRDGSLSPGYNPPPYGMQGHDIFTREPVEGKKENVKGGKDLGYEGTGAVIYEDQRAYWPAGGEDLGVVTSWMGAGTGAEPFTLWTTSDIWNHLFYVFTGQKTDWGTNPLAADDESYDVSGGGGGSGSGGGSQEGEYWGQCFNCYSDIYDGAVFVECKECGVYTEVAFKSNDGDFDCFGCGAALSLKNYFKEDLWVLCPTCENLLSYVDFQSFNSKSGEMGTEAKEDVPVLKVTGRFDGDTFVPSNWKAYKEPPTGYSINKDGEYSICFYDAKGKRLSNTFFDTDSSEGFETQSAEGRSYEKSGVVPVNVVARFPEGAARAKNQYEKKKQIMITC